MRYRIIVLFVLVAGLAWVSSAVACASAGHGGAGNGNNCALLNANPGQQASCFVMKMRGPGNNLDVSSVITPLVQPWMNGCYNLNVSAASAWVMWQSANAQDYIQVGYYGDCYYSGGNYTRRPLQYWMEYSTDGGTHHTDYFLWAWPNDGGHTFNIHRSGNTYTPTVDGQQFSFPTVTMPAETSQLQTISMEDSQVARDGRDPLGMTCNIEKFAIHPDPGWGVVTTYYVADGLHYLRYDWSNFWQSYLGFYAADYATALP